MRLVSTANPVPTATKIRERMVQSSVNALCDFDIDHPSMPNVPVSVSVTCDSSAG